MFEKFYRGENNSEAFDLLLKLIERDQKSCVEGEAPEGIHLTYTTKDGDVWKVVMDLDENPVYIQRLR